MPKLTGPDLKSLREGLLLSAQSIADRLKHAGLVPVGHVRTVQRWEEGTRPVPDDIADYLLGLDTQVEVQASEVVEQIRRVSLGSSQPLRMVAVLRYDESEHMLDAKAPHDHRLHTAALIRARMRLQTSGGPGLHFARFDPEAFEAWRAKLKHPDTQGYRSAWATEEVIKALADYPVEFEGPVDPPRNPPQRTPHPRKNTQ